MHITELRVRNFRSIDDLKLRFDRFTVFCGPNSCGKSNIFRAILLAFQPQITIQDAQTNLPTAKLVQGGPKLSIWVDCLLEGLPAPLQALAGTIVSSTQYSFRLTRAGTLTRKLGSKTLTEEDFDLLLQHFLPVYVPPIRDLNADGLVPFKRLIKTTLQRGRGPGNINQVSDSARKLLEKKATVLLEKQGALVTKLLRAEKLTLDTHELNIEAIYENLGLTVHSNGLEKPLGSLGTGHQSAVIMHLYRQLGESVAGEVLYLFEEPDNHLHPSTIRSICDDLSSLSLQSQVMVSTHSPILLAHAGFVPLRPLAQNSNGVTIHRSFNLLSEFSEKQARAYLESYGIRITEPLLSRRVLVFEGATDKAVFGSLFEERQGLTADQADILLVGAGGKDRVVTLCHILKCLGVDWYCVMDSDAALSSEVPYLLSTVTDTEKAAGVASIDSLKTLLDTSKRRGKNALNSLNAIRKELSAASPPVVHYFDNSPLKLLVEKTKTLTLTEQAQLKSALSAGRKRDAWDLLGKANTFIWSSTIESVLLHNAAAEDCVETALIAAGQLTGALTGNPNRKTTLVNKLHDSGNLPTVLPQVVRALEDGGHFKKTEVNQCYKMAFPEVLFT